MANISLLIRMADLVNEVKTLRQSNEMLNSLLAVNKAEFNKELEITRNALNELSNEKAELEIALSKITFEKEELRVSLNKKLAEREAGIDQMHLEISKFKQQVHSAETELTLLKEYSITVESELDYFKSAHCDFIKSKEELEKKLNAAAIELKEMEEERAISGAAYFEKMEEHVAIKTSLQSKLNELLAKNLEMNFQLDAISSMLNEAARSGNSRKRARTI